MHSGSIHLFNQYVLCTSYEPGAGNNLNEESKPVLLLNLFSRGKRWHLIKTFDVTHLNIDKREYDAG